MAGSKFICFLCLITILNPFGTYAGILDNPFEVLGSTITKLGNALNRVKTSVEKVEKTVSTVTKCFGKRKIPYLLPQGLLQHEILPTDDALAKMQKAMTDSSKRPADPHIVKMIQGDKYPVKTYTFNTSDNYTLTYFRIPCGKNFCQPKNRPPVLIQHGFFTDSTSWIAVEKNDSLPYILADAGYDVWLGNARGTKHSWGHANSSISYAKYWDFEWEQMGTQDIPAAIEYILKKTGYRQLYYIGHSMGTTMAFAGLSLRPEYSDKIKLFFALAPVAWLYESTTALRLAAPAEVAFEALSLLDLVAVKSELTQDRVNNLLQLALGKLCTNNLVSSVVCGNLAFLICGSDFENTNFPALLHLLGHFISSTSLNTLRHFLQNTIRDQFRRFDYGPVVNLEKYGNCTPPEYDVSKIRTKTIFMYGEGDDFSQVEDVEKLITRYNQSFVIRNYIDNPHWNHLDFLVARDVKDQIARPIMDYMGNNTIERFV